MKTQRAYLPILLTLPTYLTCLPTIRSHGQSRQVYAASGAIRKRNTCSKFCIIISLGSKDDKKKIALDLIVLLMTSNVLCDTGHAL